MQTLPGILTFAVSTSETIRVDIVVAGNTTTEHYIPRWLRIDGVEVVSVVNRTGRSSERIAKRFGIPKVYDRWTDLVAALDTDAIYIGNVALPARVRHHRSAGRRQARSDPGADGHKRSRGSRYDRRVPPAHRTGSADRPNEGGFPGMRAIPDLLSDGLIGDILSIDVVTGEFLNPDTPFWWRLDQDVNGVNTMDVGMWAESLARFPGPFTSVTVQARGHRPWRRDDEGNRRTMTVPDHVEIIAETTSGPLVHLRHSQMMLQSEPGAWFFGNEGTLKIVDRIRKLYVARRGDKRFREIETPSEHSREIEADVAFFDSIRNSTPVTHTTFDDEVRYMEFTESVLRSA